MNPIDASLILMKEQRLRFNTDQDVRLLELAIEINPFDDTNRWQRLHEIFVDEFKKPHSLRACKEHLDIIIKQYIKGASKGPPAVAEFNTLIQQVIELKKNGLTAVTKPRRSGQLSSENGHFFMDMSDGSQSVSSTTTMSNHDKKLSLHLLTCTNSDNCDCKDRLKWDVTISSETPGQDKEKNYFSYNFIPQGESAEDGFQSNSFNTPYSNNANSYMNAGPSLPEISDSTVLAYLKSKFSIEKESKEKELTLEERKLALKEKELDLQKEKFELEKLERSKRLEIELKERELHIKVIEQQQNLINMYMRNNQLKM